MTLNEQPNGVRIMLPWPDRKLNPNTHISPMAKIKPARLAKDAAYYLAKETGVTLDPEKQYRVDLVFCPPNHKARDLDNLVAALKSSLDGLSQGFGINDKMLKPVPDWGPVIKRGKVEVLVVEINP